MTVIDFILWCVAAYLFFTFVLPLLLFFGSALILGVASIIDSFSRKR